VLKEKKKKKNYINVICEKNVVDWASNDLDKTTVES
jgi:hypothetical protein